MNNELNQNLNGENDSKIDKNKANWVPAVQVFSEISTWIAIPAILGAIGGSALDKHFSTKPIMLIISSGLAFIISAWGIIKSVKKYAEKIKK